MLLIRLTAAAVLAGAAWFLVVAAAPPSPSPAAPPSIAASQGREAPIPVSVVSQPEKSWLSVDGMLTIGTLLVAVVAAGAAVLALFGPEIRYRLRLRPNLVAEVNMRPPDCLRILSVGPAPGGGLIGIATYYFRLAIHNRGRLRAENVQVMAERLEVSVDGAYRKVDTFLPLNLTWSNVGGTTLPSIGAGLARHCDLCHIQEGWGRPFDQFGVLLKFNTEVTPNPVGDDASAPTKTSSPRSCREPCQAGPSRAGWSARGRRSRRRRPVTFWRWRWGSWAATSCLSWTGMTVQERRPTL